MRVLLDTHAFLWTVSSPERLGQYEELVADPATVRVLSAASSWEIAIKHRLGQLELPEPPVDYVPEAMRRLVVAGRPIEHSHAVAVGELPDHHRDPFDRVLVAQPVRNASPSSAPTPRRRRTTSRSSCREPQCPDRTQ